MARPRGYGYPLIPDPYPVRTRSVPVGYLPCQTGYLSTLHRVPVRIGPCHASMSGPWQRVPDLAYLPQQQMRRFWPTSDSNGSQPAKPCPEFLAKDFWPEPRPAPRLAHLPLQGCRFTSESNPTG
jgi:hypothetical protein